MTELKVEGDCPEWFDHGRLCSVFYDDGYSGWVIDLGDGTCRFANKPLLGYGGPRYGDRVRLIKSSGGKDRIDSSVILDRWAGSLRDKIMKYVADRIPEEYEPDWGEYENGLLVLKIAVWGASETGESVNKYATDPPARPERHRTPQTTHCLFNIKEDGGYTFTNFRAGEHSDVTDIVRGDVCDPCFDPDDVVASIMRSISVLESE